MMMEIVATYVVASRQPNWDWQVRRCSLLMPINNDGNIGHYSAASRPLMATNSNATASAASVNIAKLSSSGVELVLFPYCTP